MMKLNDLTENDQSNKLKKMRILTVLEEFKNLRKLNVNLYIPNFKILL